MPVNEDITATALELTPNPSEVMSLCFLIDMSNLTRDARACIYFENKHVADMEDLNYQIEKMISDDILPNDDVPSDVTEKVVAKIINLPTKTVFGFI